MVIKLLDAAGWVCEKAVKGTKEYDIIARNDNYVCLFEIKYDLKSQVTGNFAFEFWNPKKNEPSGLSISQADFWVYCFGNPLQIYMVELPVLKEYIKNNTPKKIIDVGGDQNASLYLYNRTQIISDIFWKIDEIDPNGLNAGLQTMVKIRNNKFVEQDIENFCKEK